MKKNERLGQVLDIAIKAGASDIHLTNKIPPALRVDGKLTKLTKLKVNDPEILEEFARDLIGNEEEYEIYLREKEYDFSVSYNLVRFRAHVYKESGVDSISLRLIPKTVPRIEEMNLPPVLKKLANSKSGLILITGITGSGKSTTLAAMIDEINRTQSKKILTLEDPVEFVHEHKNSIINQREIGTDALSFANGVRAALREDPDIILIGEMRDLETIQNAVTLAETGHLVLGTLHTKSVAETVDRIIDTFPANQQAQIRMQVANSIEAIVCQELIPKAHKQPGRVPRLEIMVADDAARSIIREGQNPSALIDQMQNTSKTLGSQTKIQALARLIAEEKIDFQDGIKGLKLEEADLLKRTVVAFSKAQEKIRGGQ